MTGVDAARLIRLADIAKGLIGPVTDLSRVGKVENGAGHASDFGLAGAIDTVDLGGQHRNGISRWW